MKKELLLSFLAGLVLPLALAAAFQHSPVTPDVESDALSPTEARIDGAAVLTVKNRGGDLTVTVTGENGKVTELLLEGPTEVVTVMEV